MKLFFPFIVLSCIILFSFKRHDEKTTVKAVLKSATVYRSGATLTHTASPVLQQGDNELVIEGLSSYLEVNSIQINCPAAVTILGTEFSNNYLTPENISPLVKTLKDSLDQLNLSVNRVNSLINTASELLELLKMNRDVKGAQSGLNVAELMKLMNYYEVKSNEVKTNIAELYIKRTRLESISSKLNNQLIEEEAKNTVSGGRLKLQLNVTGGGMQEFSISYITQNAGWVPFYDIKADNIKSPLKLIYKAKISQTTGIDWKKVKLTLSTSAPKQYGDAPVPKTWFLSYLNPVFVMDKKLADNTNVVTAGAFGLRKKTEAVGYATARIDNASITNGRATDLGEPLSGRVSGLTISNNSSAAGASPRIVLRGLRSISGDNTALIILDGVPVPSSIINSIDPNTVERVDVLKGGQAATLFGSEGANGAIVITTKTGLVDYITTTETELDVNYEIDLPYDIATNGKQQVAVIKETTVPSSYKYYSAPRLDKSAYLQAEVTGWQGLNLLPGEANIIFEGTYIGKSVIDPAVTGDTLYLTMGIDKRIAITREKLKDYSSVKFLGSNRLQTITYEITVKNNKKDPIIMTLKDQYPKSTDKEIEVNLIESSNGNVNEETGIIAWQLNLAAGESKKIRLTYSVKFPKNKFINPN